MRTFTPGQRVIFRESETGPAESATVLYAEEPSDHYPAGGVYHLRMDDGTPTEAWWTELSGDECGVEPVDYTRDYTLTRPTY